MFYVFIQIVYKVNGTKNILIILSFSTIFRDAKITKKKAFSNMKLQVLGEKLSWFKENFDTSLNCYSLEELEELIQK